MRRSGEVHGSYVGQVFVNQPGACDVTCWLIAQVQQQQSAVSPRVQVAGQCNAVG